MLQQTRVATVIPYYRTFLRRYPNVKRLAQAPLDEVLEHWSGLGYYARARNLHRAARTIREQGGRLPRTVEDWVRLPGVGLSTAGAIVSLALDVPAVMLDANARRVLSRHQAMDPGNMNLLRRRAAALLPASRGADYTQGLMDLGAQLCTAQDPACERCPLESDCRYAASPPNNAQTSAQESRRPRAQAVAPGAVAPASRTAATAPDAGDLGRAVESAGVPEPGRRLRLARTARGLPDPGARRGRGPPAESPEA